MVGIPSRVGFRFRTVDSGAGCRRTNSRPMPSQAGFFKALTPNDLRNYADARVDYDISSIYDFSRADTEIS